jgi:hypothetical protein
MSQADKLDHETFNLYINAEIMMPYKDIATTDTIIARKKDSEGNLVGKLHPNPVLDTQVLEVQFLDGNVQELAANMIAEHICLQVKDDQLLLGGFLMYCRNVIVSFQW